MVLSPDAERTAHLTAPVVPPSPPAPAMAGVKRVRVKLARGRFELLRPRAEAGGLAFEAVKRHSGGVVAWVGPVTGGRAPVLPEPPRSPLAWSEIEHAERPVVRRTGWGPAGALLGLAGGTVYGIGAAHLVAPGGAVAAVTVGAVAIGGAFAGALAVGKREEWVRIYPEVR